MKKLYFFYFLIGFQIVCFAQIIEFPDANFKASLLLGNTAAFNATGTNFNGRIDTNNDGDIQVSEALAVTGLDIRSTPINTQDDFTNPEGIQYFTNLKQLKCSGNSLTTLDVSMLSLLEYLNCGHNDITTLNISGLSHLKEVWCNNNNLSSLITVGLTNLESLFCHSNNLSSLDFTHTQALKNLKMAGNNFTTLDLTVLPALEAVECSANPITQLTVLNMSSLREIVASGNLLTEINLTGLNNLRHLDVSFNAIPSISLSAATNLISLYISDNPLTQIDLNNSLLEVLLIENTLISTLNCSNTGIMQLSCNSNSNLTSINVKNGRISSSDPDMLYYAFYLENLPALTSVCVDNGEQNNLAYTNYNMSGNAHVYTGANCDIEVQVSMGLDNKELSSFMVYPNPATATFSVTSANNMLINQVIIYDVLGQMVKTFPAYSNSLQMDVSALSAGTYMVRITSDSGTQTRKLIKN